MNAKNILVIDDSFTLLEMYEFILSDLGYLVTTRSTGENALDFVSDTKPHLIILDMMLDGYDGRDICNALKQSQDIGHIPVIIVSATYQLEQSIRGRCQPDSFLAKPFDIVELATVIETHLAKAG